MTGCEPPAAPLLHATASTPAPHWAVLLVAVPLLLIFIVVAVLAVDRLLERDAT